MSLEVRYFQMTAPIYTLHPHELPDPSYLTQCLESGQVIYCPNQPFHLIESEQILLNDKLLDGTHKNISYHSGLKKLGGAKNIQPEIQNQLKTCLQRYAEHTEQWVNKLFPHYANTLERGRTSYRPAEIKGRQSSKRKDDTRLHVDAFPSTPLQGKRILRVFTNIHPQDLPRVWLLGEPFEAVKERFLPSASTYRPWLASVLHKLHITKTKRSHYDHLMLHLHDTMKLDDPYQQTVAKTQFLFPPESLWFVFTDLVSHAALSGQFALEQTFYLPAEGMQDPKRAPFFQLLGARPL